MGMTPPPSLQSQGTWLCGHPDAAAFLPKECLPVVVPQAFPSNIKYLFSHPQFAPPPPKNNPEDYEQGKVEVKEDKKH